MEPKLIKCKYCGFEFVSEHKSRVQCQRKECLNERCKQRYVPTGKVKFAKDFTGMMINHLYVMKEVEPLKKFVEGRGFENKRRYLVKCNLCNSERIILATALYPGKQLSCGCGNKIPDNGAMINRVYHQYQTRGIQKHGSFDIGLEKFKELIVQPCHYCGAAHSNTGQMKRIGKILPHNGLDRKDSSKGYFIENVVPCCKFCNFMKRDMSYDKFIEHLKKMKDTLKL